MNLLLCQPQGHDGVVAQARRQRVGKSFLEPSASLESDRVAPWKQGLRARMKLLRSGRLLCLQCLEPAARCMQAGCIAHGTHPPHAFFLDCHCAFDWLPWRVRPRHGFFFDQRYGSQTVSNSRGGRGRRELSSAESLKGRLPVDFSCWGCTASTAMTLLPEATPRWPAVVLQFSGKDSPRWTT